ncbi:hypothetical protein L208DRAFT_1413732 [Tricholoma matsutake]|nr:hypothetical protein L208DRAFT_1413732 [Tricholoma matsutake 945]
MDTQASTQCSWSPAGEERMITFLCSKKEAAAGGANFKPAVWNALIVEMAPHLGPGAHKTTKACKSKYGQLWSAYTIVSTLKGLSGFGEQWDDEKGMNIGVGEVDAWNAYCMKHDKAKAYTHKGFPLYNLMSRLMPILGKGTHAFHPSNQTWGASSAISTIVPEPLSNDETTANTVRESLYSLTSFHNMHYTRMTNTHSHMFIDLYRTMF